MLQTVDCDDLKLTRNQSLVLSVLQSSDQLLSAYRILDRLRDEGFKAPLQVYRALENCWRQVAFAGWKASTPSSSAFTRNTGRSIRASPLSRSASPAARSTSSTTRRSRTRWLVMPAAAALRSAQPRSRSTGCAPVVTDLHRGGEWRINSAPICNVILLLGCTS